MEIVLIYLLEVANLAPLRWPRGSNERPIKLIDSPTRITCDIMGSDCTQRSILNKAHAHWNRDNAAVPDRAPHAHALMHYSCTCSMMSHTHTWMVACRASRPTSHARQDRLVKLSCVTAHTQLTIHTRTGASLRLSLGLSPARPSSRCGRRSPTVAACTARAS